MQPVRLFISHSWKHDSYDGILNLLNGRGYFEYKNSSVPQSTPLFGSNNEIWSAIERKIKWCQIVILTVDVHASYSGSIKREIDLAKNYKKPIVAVIPNGAERTSSLRFYADRVVGWRSDSIVNAIRELK